LSRADTSLIRVLISSNSSGKKNTTNCRMLLSLKSCFGPPPGPPGFDPESILSMAKGIQTFGWRQAVIVNQDKVIVAGHRRFLAYQNHGSEFNLKPVWIIDDTGNTLHGAAEKKAFTEAEGKAFRIWDNKTAEDSMTDLSIVGLEIDDLGKMGFDISLTGYTDLNLEDLRYEPIGDEAGSKPGGPGGGPKQDFKESNIRQFVVFFLPEEFEDIKTRIKEVSARLKDKELFMGLLNTYENAQDQSEEN